MNYNSKTRLWKRPENHFDLIRNMIASLALLIENSAGQLYSLYDPKEKSQTMIKITYDWVNKRTLIRTETTPDINPPKKLVGILEKHQFEKII